MPRDFDHHGENFLRANALYEAEAYDVIQLSASIHKNDRTTIVVDNYSDPPLSIAQLSKGTEMTGVGVGKFARIVGESAETVRWHIATEAEPWATSPQAKEGGHRRFKSVHVIAWTLARQMASLGLPMETAAEAVRVTQAAERFCNACQTHLPLDLWLGVFSIEYRDAAGLHRDLRFEVGSITELNDIATSEAESFGRPYASGVSMGCGSVLMINTLAAWARARETAKVAGYNLTASSLESALMNTVKPSETKNGNETEKHGE